ncbi:MAG: tetratricopeptide repeat protein [Campylobacterales bacterium]|nr:tetratricopeptide repeat protein [Campylobacterales bacterium]
MNTFFIEFRDPLFSIIIFFALVFIITFFSYWWGRYKRKEDYRHLDTFLKQFRSLPSQKELKGLITKGELPEKSWLLLAHSYYKSGDYEKSIEIYNEMLKVGDKSNYKETMFLLGRTYFRAGFLERAKNIFLEILKNNPRTPQALTYLLLVYEYMKDYNSALEVLDSLDELKKDILSDSAYIKSLAIINDIHMPINSKIENLLDIYKHTYQLTYLVYEYLFRVNPKVAWGNFNSANANLLTDVLWRLKKEDLDLDIIRQNGYLSELYTARGDVDFATKSSIFEFDVLINLKKECCASLNFEYICNNCKQVYPFGFSRCSNCHSINTQSIESILSKNYQRDFSEENNSFQ